MCKTLQRKFCITSKLIQNSKNEYLIQVNDKDEVIGKISKYEAHLKENIDKGILHRAFSIYLIDPTKGLLLQQRSKYKATFANLWTNTCCSHPLYNKNELEENDNIGIKKAAQRRLEYELELMIKIHKINLENMNVNQKDDYTILLKKEINGQINFNKEEIQDIKFCSIKDIQKLQQDINRNQYKYTPWFNPTLKKVLDYMSKQIICKKFYKIIKSKEELSYEIIKV